MKYQSLSTHSHADGKFFFCIQQNIYKDLQEKKSIAAFS